MQDYEEGLPAIIEASNFFRGKKIAVFLHKCKDHDGAHIFHLIDPTATVKRICVDPSKRGDSVILISELEK